MNCGCNKNIGCYVTGDDIQFGINAPFDGFYTFEIMSNGSFSDEVVEFEVGDPIVLPFTFNENSTTLIKIKTPSGSPVPYLTSADGACCFEVQGIIPIC
jgi:hypothetical protein